MAPSLRLSFAVLAAAGLAGCASLGEPEGPPRPETVWAVNEAAELLQFNAGQPRRLLRRVPLQGLAEGDRLVGIDFRVARGVLYALSRQGQLYTLDTKTGRLSAVGAAAPVALQGERFGFDFNPAADRIRVVSDVGQNLRLHPDTGAVAATDPALHWAVPGLAVPVVAAAGYTYNKTDERLATHYAIELRSGALLMQGSREGAQPVASPDTGQLRAVGTLGTGALEDAALDIADVGNTALAALRSGGRTRLHLLDLGSGRATLLGTVGDGGALWGLAIEP